MQYASDETRESSSSMPIEPEKVIQQTNNTSKKSDGEKVFNPFKQESDGEKEPNPFKQESDGEKESDSFEQESDSEEESDSFEQESVDEKVYHPTDFKVNSAAWEEYKGIREKFVNYKATKEILNDLEKLAKKGIDNAAFDIGRYAMTDPSERERAKKLLKNITDPYATHILGIFEMYGNNKEEALRLLFKAREMGVAQSLNAIIFTIEANSDLIKGKYAEEIKGALDEYNSRGCFD